MSANVYTLEGRWVALRVPMRREGREGRLAIGPLPAGRFLLELKVGEHRYRKAFEIAQ